VDDIGGQASGARAPRRTTRHGWAAFAALGACGLAWAIAGHKQPWVDRARFGNRLPRPPGRRADLEAPVAGGDDFVLAVSHELRTPLTHVHGYAELMTDEGRALEIEELREMALEVRRASSTMLRLVDDLLDYSRLRSGRFELRRASLDLGELIRSVAAGFVHRPDLHRIVLDLPDEPLPVRADGDRLRQVLGNLVSNAIRYSPEGGEVRIRAGRTAESVRVEVTDHGVGIPPEERELVFESFYRGTGGLVSPSPGSGLGLAIVKHLVEAHGGTVGVESSPGRGSTFWFVLAADHTAWLPRPGRDAGQEAAMSAAPRPDERSS
jgi:signal transduction histidine kinase